MIEEGIERPENARELAIQRLKMKQDFKGIAAGGALAILVCTVIWLMGDGDYYWPVWEERTSRSPAGEKNFF